MKSRSAKNKGVRLQNWVKTKILKIFPEISDEDVKCAIMGEKGRDIKLSQEASNIFPYAIECKNVEKLNVYKAFAQAEENQGDLEPALIMKKNNHRPLAVIDAEHFIHLVRCSTLEVEQIDVEDLIDKFGVDVIELEEGDE